MTHDKDALIAEYRALETKALQARVDFGTKVLHLRDGVNALTVQGGALRAEHAQRARAGVRVTANAGDLDSRTSAFYCEQATHWSTKGSAVNEEARRLESMLMESLRMCARMADALNGPEHAAALRAQAEAEAQAAAEAAEEAAAAAAAAEKAAVAAAAEKAVVDARRAAANTPEALRKQRDETVALLREHPEYREDARIMTNLRCLEREWVAVLGGPAIL